MSIKTRLEAAELKANTGGNQHMVWIEDNETPDSAIERFKRERPTLAIGKKDTFTCIGYEPPHEQADEITHVEEH